MGLSSSKQKTTSTSTGNATTTPQAPAWLQGPVSDYYGRVGNLLNSNTQPTANPASQLQNQAFAGASNLSGTNQGLSDAMNTTRGLLNYTPQNVNAQQLSQTDLNPYMNPYTQNVIDTSLNSLDRFRQGAISNNQASATQAGAYGGSRHGVADAETNRGFLDQAGALAANLYNQNFNQAQQGAQFDIGNRLNADQFNVNSGLQGAQFQGNMASQLAQQGLAGDANSRANIGMQADLGAQQRDINYQNDPQQQQMQFLSQLQQLLGISGNSFIGQNVQSSGTQTGTTSGGSNGWLGGLGSLAEGLGAMGVTFSDRRLKYDIVPRADTINGTPLYEYSYVWDEPGVRHVGVMAQEAPPHAVIVMDNGYLAVDYGSL